jgi:hypothetical protein
MPLLGKRFGGAMYRRYTIGRTVTGLSLEGDECSVRALRTITITSTVYESIQISLME